MTLAKRADLAKHLRMYHLSRELLDYLTNEAERTSQTGVHIASLAFAAGGYTSSLRADIFRLGGMAAAW